MGKHENGASPPERDHHRKSISESEPDPDSDSEEEPRKSEGSRKRAKDRKSSRRTSGSKRRGSRDSDSYTSSSEHDEDSHDSESDSGDSEQSDSRRRRRKERKRKEEKRERRRREKEKEKKRKRKEDEKRRKKKRKEKKEKEKGKKGAVTNSWGKYGLIKETDMWNKRPEFTAWLAEVKKVNLESLPNWEEKQLFKDFMEDHNTATFPSKKYYNLDAYYEQKMVKEMKKGISKVHASERTVFNDEEQRRLELQSERERQKEAQVEALKRSMQGGMAQAMKEQAQLKEEMAYQYKLGNFEVAAAIQRRLDPDIAM